MVGCMLDVTAVGADQGGGEGLEGLAERGDEFGLDQVLYGLLLF